MVFYRSYLPKIDKTSERYVNGLLEGVTPDPEQINEAEFSVSVIENGWYHEVERVFYFTNNNHEYVFDASEYRLHIYRTDPKTGKTEEIANYQIDNIYSQITGAF